jgi:hypothetical protein
MFVYPLRNPNVEKKFQQTDVLFVAKDLQNLENEGKLRTRQTIQDVGEGRDCTEVFYDDNKYMLNLLRAIGVLPLQRNKTGNIITDHAPL